MYFDTHAHYTDEQFNTDGDMILSMMKENNIGKIMNACASMEDLDPIIKLIDKYDFIYGSVGVHPSDAGELTESDMDTLKEYAKHKKIKAVGEIGLDYYYDDVPKNVQKEWFARHAEEVGGILHCFSGSREMAREVLDLGMYIAFGGTVTFKNAVRPVEVASYVPLESMVLETDCPYLTPVPCRGKKNCSLYLPIIAEKIATLRSISVKEVEEITMINGMKCFDIA